MKVFDILFPLWGAFIVMSACSSVTPELAPQEMKITFYAVQEELPSSKTSLGGGKSVIWSTSDKITVFSATGSAGKEFSVASVDAGGTLATFTGLGCSSTNGYYYAVYPASNSARLVSTSGTISASLPTVQNGAENSFDGNANLSVAMVNADATADNDVLHFKNAGALLSFIVPGNYINRVKIESRDGALAMSGPANIQYNDGQPVVSPTSSSKNYVEVNVPQSSAGKKFYAVVYPGNYAQGFNVTFYTSSNAFNRYSSSAALELPRNGNVSLIRKNWLVSDDRAANSEAGTELIAPEIISGGQASATSASIKFRCSSGKRDTYKFYLRDAATFGDGEFEGSLNTGSAQYGNYSYTFTGLVTGRSYDLGVSASCASDNSLSDSPIVWLEDITINAAVSGMDISVQSTAVNYYNFIVNYTISGLSSTGAEHGLIFSYSNPAPTCGAVGAEGKLPGPILNSTGTVNLCQCIPNAPLRVGETCYVRAYCFDNASGNYVYSPVQQLRLGTQPSGYGIDKTAMNSPSEAVSIYQFTAEGTYKGYYASASCGSSSPVRLGVYNAKTGTTDAISMASQLSSSAALVLINGQIFGSQGNIGIAYSGGALRYNNSSDDGISACRGYGNNYSSWQPITRAIFGVDANGKPGAYWCSLIDGTPYFFDRPIPAGTGVYPQVSAGSGPGPARSWSPWEALSTGPMLLYDGKICVSEDRISTGVYYTNYELWDTSSGSIYGSSRQRTAIGYDSASGKIYLVVVTSNVTLTSLARIMKGIGCDFAMNLDGGGSTQMNVSGTGALTSNTRHVKSTVGFFLR